ncbi:RloB family protein [Planctomycetota bacterium]
MGLIVCEGSCTEPAYFESLIQYFRLHAIRVHVMASDDSEPINVVELAIAKKTQGVAPGLPYSQIWCVIDVEVPSHRTLGEARDKAASVNDLEFILTNPSFEYWFLLHFAKIVTPFQSNTDIQCKLKQFHPTYKKTRIGFNILFPLTESAIRHSKEVLREQHNDAQDLSDCNPSTHVHKIVEYLQNAAQ